MALKKVLIVEDEQLIAEDISAALKKSGYDVIGISASGEDALEKAWACQPDVISMDIRIRGDMDGIETAQHIKKAREVPIIFLTSSSDHETMRRAKAVSSWFLLKPLFGNELVETIAKALASPGIYSASYLDASA